MISNLALWSGIVAFLLPLLLSVINQSKWPSAIKTAVFFVVCLIAAGATAAFQGDLTGRRWLDSSLIILAGAAALYHGLWKPSGIAPLIEERTNLAAPPPAKKGTK